jgi:hypothetical protein
MVEFNSQATCNNPTKVLNSILYNTDFNIYSVNVGTTKQISNASGVYSFSNVNAISYISAAASLPTSGNSSSLTVYVDISTLVTYIQKIYSVIYGTSPTLAGFTSLSVKSLSATPLVGTAFTKNYLISSAQGYIDFVNGITGESLSVGDFNSANNILYSYLYRIVKNFNCKFFCKYLDQTLELNDNTTNVQNLMLTFDPVSNLNYDIIYG